MTNLAPRTDEPCTPTQGDPIHNPPHYTAGEIECKDAIRAALTREEFRGWVKGNAFAYLWRERLKGGDQDIDKAVNFLEWLKEVRG